MAYCSRTIHLTDPILVQLVETVAHVRKCSLEHVISDAVAYRYGSRSPVVEDALPLGDVQLITEHDGDDD